MRKVNRRKFMKLAGTAVLAASMTSVLGACDGAPEEPSAPEAPSSSVDTGAGDSGDTGHEDSSSGSSEPEEEPQKIIWKISANGDGTAELVGYDRAGATPSGTVTLPEKVSGSTITSVDMSIGNKVTKIIIPGCIKKVGNLSRDNKSLQEVVIQQGVEQLAYENWSMTYSPFLNCVNLTRVQLPSTLKIINMTCFYGCKNLKKISLPEGLTKLGANAFTNSGLTDIVIPASVTEVQGEVFRNSALESATLKGSVCGSNMFEECDKLETVTLSEKTESIPSRMFKNCRALKKIKLPSKLKKIGFYAFSGCTSLQTVIMPTTISEMGDNAFENCKALQQINVPSGVTKLEGYTFSGCSSLKSIYIPRTVNEVGYYTFDGCSKLKDVYYQASESMWTRITIAGSGNGFLTAANLHPNSSPLVIV